MSNIQSRISKEKVDPSFRWDDPGASRDFTALSRMGERTPAQAKEIAVPARRDFALLKTSLRSACEDCEHSVPAGRTGAPILICRHKADTDLPWQVVEPDEGCANFEQSREIVPLDIAAALAEGAKLIPLTQGKFAIVDAEDYERLSKYKWHVSKGSSTYYARRYKNGKNVRMHRLILNAPRHLLVDHINHNGLDNRKSNLRLCTRSRNNRNKRPHDKTSRYKGVCRNKRRNIFVARIYMNGKRIFIGHFTDEIAAAKAYDKAAKELFGEFAYLNFPEDYGLPSPNDSMPNPNGRADISPQRARRSQR